jgi:CheY-like chemotaxis protein
VLVVDDDATIRKMVARALGAEYTVYEAADGLAALEILPRIAEPAVIVCDVMMPQIDGVTLVRELRKQPHLKGIPVIFLTAKSSPKDFVLGINAGARHYLTKPFSVKDLLDKVASIVKTRPAKAH